MLSKSKKKVVRSHLLEKERVCATLGERKRGKVHYRLHREREILVSDKEPNDVAIQRICFYVPRKRG